MILKKHPSPLPARHPRPPPGARRSIPIPLDGSYHWIGEYYSQVTIGGQRANVLIDTGSSDLAVSSTLCKNCKKKIIPWYNPKKSGATPVGCEWCKAHVIPNMTSTNCTKDDQCTFLIEYEDGSKIENALYRDTVQFGTGAHAAPATNNTAVGAYLKQSVDDVKTVDGMLGIADMGCSSSGATTPWDDLVAQHQVRNVFAMCLPYSTGQDHATDGGVLYLGADDESTPDANATIAGVPLSLDKANDGDILWTKRKAGSPFWTFDMEDMLVAGKPLGIAPAVWNTGDAIVDSGSSVAYIPHEAWEAFKKAINAVCYKKSTCVKGLCKCNKLKPLDYDDSVLSGSCFHLTQAEIAKYPMVEIKFKDGGVVPMPPQNYLRSGTQFCSGKGPYSMGISDNKPDAGTALGDTFMMNQLIVHDRIQQRIGFQTLKKNACP